MRLYFIVSSYTKCHEWLLNFYHQERQEYLSEVKSHSFVIQFSRYSIIPLFYRCVISVITTALAFTLNSCDMFTTRSPEEPETPRSNFVAATTPEILLQNLQDAFSEKISENYLSCFIDSSFSDKRFAFSPSAGSSSLYPFLLDWTLQGERQYFINLTNSVETNSPIILTFTNEERNFQGDSTSYSAQYSISVPTTDVQKPKYYQGTLHFTMIRDNRLQWVVFRWEDIKDEKYPSWSELKGRYY